VAQESAFGAIWLYRGENFGRPMGAPEEDADSPPASATTSPEPEEDEATAPSPGDAVGEEHTVDKHE
jgi:hypothetical protein